ncbi:MAG: hypothetical protein ACJAVI_004757, partial [Candidatus Azotimanducaceae bacterium]
ESKLRALMVDDESEIKTIAVENLAGYV